MKKCVLRASLIIISCILLQFLFFACEQDSSANTNFTNDETQPVSGESPATPATNTPSSTTPATNTPSGTPPESATPSSSTPPDTPASDPELPEGTYSITFVLDGGSWIEGYTPVQTYTAEQNVSLPNAGKVHKEGFTFKGWYENNSLKFGFAKGTTGNKTYTAKWEEGQHTPAGYYNSGSGDTACPAGKYQDSIDSTNCSTCNAGTYQNNEGATGCFTTPAGSYSFEGASAPTKCAAGTYSTEGASSCTMCPAGKYSSAGSATCTSCSVGYYQSNNGSSSCIASPAGKYVSTKGATTATPCPVGTYQDQTGQSSCKSCPEGTTSAVGSTSIDACH